jgi:hypothetical protein
MRKAGIEAALRLFSSTGDKLRDMDSATHPPISIEWKLR